MNKFRKRLREIERLAGVVIESATVAGSGHVRLVTRSGHSITISGSPSCPFAAKHAAADLRRAMKGLR